jgi:hypothetical protein
MMHSKICAAGSLTMVLERIAHLLQSDIELQADHSSWDLQ